jgi:hypothetical protein
MAEPSFALAEVSFVETILGEMAGGSVIVSDKMDVHALESVTVIKYIPAPRFGFSNPETPFDQRAESGDVPPDAMADKPAVLSPAHRFCEN